MLMVHVILKKLANLTNVNFTDWFADNSEVMANSAVQQQEQKQTMKNILQEYLEIENI